ncbi:ComEC/Rec2 family competence protein [Burkholderia pseudomallei]|uniref:hypothetical protein n=1 Tax=Burkholderia pseudomallei TaxID=28450 RepID=UPI000F2AAF33|nr:hypothetical protein [Burkholderia pseudomallei]CAJ2766841.1 DNA internalization-related competence protein ComEC/Rec2 [Burkholderia pseudomallei]VCJ20439.1 DNA internalization-related competence protein ComEC/Rec2 [Burkholderia pseudomallei]
MDSQPQRIPDGVMYCKLETSNGVKDYAPRVRCVRLFGVSLSSFQIEEWTDANGCEVHILDISIRDWIHAVNRAHHELGVPWWKDLWLFHEESSLGDSLEESPWVEVKYKLARGPSDSYAYPAFTGSAPTYIEIDTVQFAWGPAIPPLAEASSLPTYRVKGTERDWKLEGFHVGQGMCSVFHNDESGFLLDAGAGTPVNREAYQAESIANELMPLVEKLATSDASLPMIISHPDADHWRLLDWDVELLNRVGPVYLPSGRPSLAFNSHIIKPRVHGIGTRTLFHSGPTSLSVYRSAPTSSDKNGECLVTVCEAAGKKALLPGDYVYKRMKSEAGTPISLLSAGQFDAVVVPHHGDEASSEQVFLPGGSESKAFFSAGTHQGYGHPTQSSIDAHRAAGFDIVEDHAQRDIVSVPLIP